MTDYSNIVTDDIRILEANSNGGTPYDTLVLDIDEGGDVSLWTNTVYGSSDGIPFDVWHGRTRRYLLAKGPGVVHLDYLRDMLCDGGKLSVLIDRVIAGHDVEWNGSNMVGTLTDDAADADEDLDRWTDRNSVFDDRWSVWDEAEWIWDEAKGLVTSETTDEEIDAYLADARSNAPEDCVVLVGDARKLLIEMRNEKREDEAVE